MSKAEDFLKWWILNNVHREPDEGNQRAARAQKLARTFTLAATQLGIDKEDPILDPQWLYDQMFNAIEQP
jgi:hypothetical protein